MTRAFNLFIVLSISGALSLYTLGAGAEETTQHTGILLQAPAPQLKWETWKEIVRETGKPGSEIYCRVRMTISKGQIQSAAMVQSSGFQSADGEICEWVQKAWHFKPQANGSFVLPLTLNLPRAVPGPDPVKSVAFYTSYPPFPPKLLQQMQKQADNQKSEVTLKIEVTVQVDRGQILACIASKKTGTVLDDDVPYWIEDRWIFKKGVSGTWCVPLIFSVKPKQPQHSISSTNQ